MVKNMKNKDKYSLNKLKISTTHTITGISDIKIYHGIKCVYYRSYIVEEFALRWITDFMKWLEKDDEKECKPKILTDEEKAYLSAVIKPFRKDIKYIVKFKRYSDEKEYIYMTMKRDDYCTLPIFKKGTMYKGMETNKRYTLEELGL